MNNTKLLERSLAAVWHPCTQMQHHEEFPPIPILTGDGVWLQDYEGNRYLDAISSWWVNLFGHRNPYISQAIVDQLGRLEHVMLAGFTHEPVVELSERLSAKTGNRLGHCFYGSDGASATEVALKMSAHFWRNQGMKEKTEFLAVADSYHGETLGALGVTDVALFRDSYGPLIRRCAVIPSPDTRRGEDAVAAALERLEELLRSHHGRIAALIVEPLVQAAAGMVFHPPRFLSQARLLCNQYSVHLIADEIAVGFGRTGTFFAHDQAGITPDFLCLSKGITGGFLPLSVVLTTASVYQEFYDPQVTRGFLHSHSYTGNALACSAGLAVLDLFETMDILAANSRRQQSFGKMSQELMAFSGIRNFRNLGMIWAFEADSDSPGFARQFHQAALKREILLRPIDKTIYFMPPYTISDEEFALMVDRTLECLKESMA